MAGLFLVVTLPFVPWQLYLEHSGTVAAHVATSWNGSAWRLPILLPFAAIAIWILRKEGGAWHAVGALWPGTQFYYNSMALRRDRQQEVVTALLAVPVPLMAPVVVIGLAAKHADRCPPAADGASCGESAALSAEATG